MRLTLGEGFGQRIPLEIKHGQTERVWVDFAALENLTQGVPLEFATLEAIFKLSVEGSFVCLELETEGISRGSCTFPLRRLEDALLDVKCINP